MVTEYGGGGQQNVMQMMQFMMMLKQMEEDREDRRVQREAASQQTSIQERQIRMAEFDQKKQAIMDSGISDDEKNAAIRSLYTDYGISLPTPGRGPEGKEDTVGKAFKKAFKKGGLVAGIKEAGVQGPGTIAGLLGGPEAKVGMKELIRKARAGDLEATRKLLPFYDTSQKILGAIEKTGVFGPTGGGEPVVSAPVSPGRALAGRAAAEEELGQRAGLRGGFEAAEPDIESLLQTGRPEDMRELIVDRLAKQGIDQRRSEVIADLYMQKLAEAQQPEAGLDQSAFASLTGPGRGFAPVGQ